MDSFWKLEAVRHLIAAVSLASVTLKANNDCEKTNVKQSKKHERPFMCKNGQVLITETKWTALNSTALRGFRCWVF